MRKALAPVINALALLAAFFLFLILGIFARNTPNKDIDRV